MLAKLYNCNYYDLLLDKHNIDWLYTVWKEWMCNKKEQNKHIAETLKDKTEIRID